MSENTHDKCVKQQELQDMKRDIQVLTGRIRDIELKDVEKEKDLVHIQQNFDQLNQTLGELKLAIEELSKAPYLKYEKAAWLVISSFIAFIMGRLLG